jgi:integrase
LPEGFGIRDIDKLAGPLVMPGGLTHHAEQGPILVKHVAIGFCDEADRRGGDAATLAMFRDIADDLVDKFGEMPADEFGPRSLKSLRDTWEQSGRFCRRYVNTRVNTVIRFFRSAVANELCEESVHRRLRTLEPLRRGHSVARDNPERQAADLEIVRATAEHLTPTLRDMVAVQVSTGMRPTELLTMRPCDIDRTADVWLYRPASHKNINKGKSRTIAIVDHVRAIIENYLNRPSEAYLFSPAESERERKAIMRLHRKSKVQPSQLDRSKAARSRPPRSRYTADSYRRAIRYACQKAKVTPWTPYEIRHLTAVVVRDALGLESSQAILGHSDIRTTQRYAKQTNEKLIQAAKAAPRLRPNEME